jgi:hypothetical protein
MVVVQQKCRWRSGHRRRWKMEFRNIQGIGKSCFPSHIDGHCNEKYRKDSQNKRKYRGKPLKTRIRRRRTLIG